MLPTRHPLISGRTAESALIRSYQGERTSPLPVWFMRQAGRSLPEYREIRAGHSMLESCLNPELVHEITMQPVRRHGVDAAILFSDIVIPLKLAGVAVEIVPNVGPVIANPVRARADFERLGSADNQDFGPIVDAVGMLGETLGSTPLIGFGGAPFTLASYLIEGGPSKTIPHSRQMMKADPELWADVLDWCADVTASFIRAQVLAGASALQVFDSWAGRLGKEEYSEFAAPHSKRLFDSLQDLRYEDKPVPRVHFGLGTFDLLEQMAGVGATVMGVDYHSDLSAASKKFNNLMPLQGNIDPQILGLDFDQISHHVSAVIESGRSAPSHVVNLGHGVPPQTDPNVLTRIVELIHQESS